MNIDKRALREVAERATQGPWEMEQENIWFTDEDGYTKHLAYVEQGDDVDDKQDHYNTAYIAAANHATMLALLDELETKEEQRANWFRMAQKLGEDLDTAERLIAELDQRLIEYAGIATREARRVAELEARKVNLSKLSVGEVMHMSGFSRDYAEGWCAGNDNAIHEIRTAGIKVKGE
ncbi:ead/Ea22-like family protein [Salmonella enterica subsp. enterica serovar Ohio]|nr:ead/Ea22-like family protein [Salmonella enterica subsp. enterica serovar Ohio]EED7565581.1 ead/Ea22-like family protein [Salmonella enterica subsp. enterica serovar Ohio]